jgi:hypothetical protein
MQDNPIVILFTAPSPACLERLIAWLVPSRRGGGGAASLFSLLLLLLLLLLLPGAMLSSVVSPCRFGGQGTINPLLLRDVAFCQGCLGELGMRRRPNPSGGNTLGTGSITGSITGSSQAARNAIKSVNSTATTACLHFTSPRSLQLTARIFI